MKRLWMSLIALWLSVAVGPVMAACDPASEAVETKIQQLQNSLEQQIERVQDARSGWTTGMGSARLGVVEALTKSQEDLMKQIAGLERLREQISAEKEKSDQAVEMIREDWAQRFAASLSSIETQLTDANSLIRRLESMREQVDTESDSFPTGGDLPTLAMPAATDPITTVTPPTTAPTPTLSPTLTTTPTTTLTTTGPAISPVPPGG